MRRSRFLPVAALTLSLLLFSCVKRPTDVGSIAVISVNGQAMTARLFSRLLAKRLKNYDALAAKDPSNIQRVKDEIIKNFIMSSLLAQFVKSKRVEVATAEVDEEIDKTRKSYPNDVTFRASLAEEGTSIDELRENIEQSLLEKKAFQLIYPLPPPSALEAEAKKYYLEHKQEFNRPEQAHILQIVVAKEEEANKLLKQIRQGATFGELAKKFSNSPDAADGGDIGFISKGVVPVFDIAFKMPKGQISGVVKSSYGFHIIKVLDKRPALALPYEKAKEQIFTKINAKRQQEAFNAWLESTLKTAKVEKNDNLIDKISVQTEGH